MFVEQARAKLNLYLHITGKRADGYHVLDSLVVFTSLADQVRVSPANTLTLTVDGPFAALAGEDENNLVLRAAHLLQHHTNTAQGAAVQLTKNIPVGAGLGGGSADAAAALRALNQLWSLNLPSETLVELGRSLGADVAMCVASTPAIARGVGDVLTHVTLPTLHAVLVYPRVLLPTPDVYRAFRLEGEKAPVALPPVTDSAALLAALQPMTNDLASAAISQCAAVGDVLHALASLVPASPYVRMSGSGACCFALYESSDQAARAADALRHAHADWWVEAVELIPSVT